MRRPIFLTKKWQEKHLKQLKNRAGKRYTPELNVELPLAQIFEGLSRSQNFYFEIRTHYGLLLKQFDRTTRFGDDVEIKKQYELFSRNVIGLLEELKRVKEYTVRPIAWEKISAKAYNAEELSWELSTRARKLKETADPKNTENSDKKSSQDWDSFLYYVSELRKELHYFTEFSVSTSAKLSNNPFLLLGGGAGSGKTHLLCDVAVRRIREQKPISTTMVFGEFFSNQSDCWKQIAEQLNLPNHYTKVKILEKLNESGRRAKTKSLLVIDALNETKVKNFWKRNLQKLCEDVSRYPHIGVIVSIRSGFEGEVFTKRSKKIFIEEQHSGFKFREWEAVTKFFKEFSLPLPEIPLLMPEFQHPLFLLLFCKAFENPDRRSKGKPIFKGHEGATYIFESFVKNAANKIADKFSIPRGKASKNGYVIWDTVIEKMASEMVENKDDRISEKRLFEIVQNVYPKINHGDFIAELEKSFLLEKVRHYDSTSKEFVGFDFRFPFQKFSDHLIARYIFRKYDKEKKTPVDFFREDSEIGKFLKNGWNIGVIEALAIQSPERLNGMEFFELAPYLDQHTLSNAFIESIIWRRPDAFRDDRKPLTDFINTRVTDHDYLLNAFIAVATIPEHKFNMNFLHNHLFKLSMAERDSWWSKFLHLHYGGRGPVDGLLQWGWSSESKKHIADDAIELSGLCLAWFLTTSNRYLRDKATKALVELLTDRLLIITRLLQRFQGVNDLYILERLYAVAYGCAIRNKEDKTGLKYLAEWIYGNIFSKDKVLPHLLIRDYARGVVQVANDRGAISVPISRINPPYKSRFPIKVPTADTLRKKYLPESGADGRREIWSSVMHTAGSLADFGRYVVESALHHWSGKRLFTQEPDFEQTLAKYVEGLTLEQKGLLQELIPSLRPKPNEKTNKKIEKIIINWTDQKLGEELAKMEAEKRKSERAIVRKFNSTLTASKRKIFDRTIRKFLGKRWEIVQPYKYFPSSIGERWIFNRVMQFGWTEELHGDFDRNVKSGYGYTGRSERKVERIGKKYQWIALFEFLALVADNFSFKKESWSDAPSEYKGPWQLSIRDIDPTCTLKDTPIEEASIVPIFNPRVFTYNTWFKNWTDTQWLSLERGLPNPKSFIELTDDHKDNWFVLEGHFSWKEKTPPELDEFKVPQRRLWYMIRSYLVKTSELKELFRWTKRQNFFGRWMPESHDFYGTFLGEFPSSPAFLDQVPNDEWTDSRFNKKVPVKVLVTDTGYMSSGSSIDCSTENTVKVKLPCKWLVDRMDLNQRYVDGRFFDSKNNLVAFDPFIFNQNMPSCCVIRKDSLCTFLEKNEYSVLWTLLAEKQAIGVKPVPHSRGWLEINGSYTLDQNSNLRGSMRVNRSKLKS